MEKRFVVTVTEIGLEQTIIGRQWMKGAKPRTEEDEDGYGYTPETEATREYKREVYTQTVQDLNLAALVSVVNKIARPASSQEGE